MKNTHRIVYNRVPKCGSTTTLKLIKKLSNINKFKLKRSKIYLEWHVSSKEQEILVKNISRLEQPFLYDRHIYFIDFSIYGYTTPVYINLVRDPVERFVSSYYYERQVRKENYNPEAYKRTINTCVEEDHTECTLNNSLIALPFFCGHDPVCQFPNMEALNRAKQNVVKYYGVVGLIEEYLPFLEVLSCVFPQYFKGADKMYRKSHEHAYKTKHKDKISPQNKMKLKTAMKYEYDFYDFIKQRFHYLYESKNQYCKL